MSDITFEVVEQWGVIKVNDGGWSKEVNWVAWNGQPAKLDIRDWDPGHERMSRGITMTEKEARTLYEILHEHYGEE